MEALRRHEVFELEVLQALGKSGHLKSLVFGGGTMMRLCHDLPRYSVDLDFWFSRKVRFGVFFERLLRFFRERWPVTDSQDKHFTLLYEIQGRQPGRKLKIEIRNEVIARGIEQRIAYSPHASLQVLVPTLSLEAMLKRKMLALRERNEMRDYFDIEFLMRKGAKPHFSDADKALIEKRISAFGRKDYRGVLGGLLEKGLRGYYLKNGFSYLLERLRG